jgi:nucleoid DNA-binding protein
MEENQATPPKKPMNKTEILTQLAEATGLAKQQVSELFDQLAKLIEKNLDADGPGVFVVPNLLQIKVVRKPAVEARMGINPFTKQEMMLKAKPAQNVVKLVALKGLKDLVAKKAE